VKPSSLNLARRARELEQLDRGEVVDLLVVGGGITGVGIALDAATRGLSVALVERRDLANGTSRWSSKLVHGGIRYLAKGNVRLAHESAVERGILLEHTAPHLTRALGMVAPVGVGFTAGRAAMTYAGYAVGNALRIVSGTARSTLPPPAWVTANESRLLVPALSSQGLRGGVLTWDGQLTDDARLVVAVARTAAAFGARILTYAEVEEVTSEGALVRDGLSGTALSVRARQVVNATGVWADRLHPEVELRPSRGAHLVLPAERLGRPRAALAVPVPGESNRYVFALPQIDEDRVFVGLTDDPVDVISDNPAASEADETFLLSVLSTALEVPLTPQDVVGSFAGLRPLLAGAEGTTADLSRDHRILERADGLVTIVGGKLTTYRKMAEDVVDRIVARRGTDEPCVTGRQPLVGAASRSYLASMAADRRLVARYGAEADEVEALLRDRPELAEPVVAGSLHRRVELAWGVEHEGALTVDDLLDRRTRIGLVPIDRAGAAEVAARFSPGGATPRRVEARGVVASSDEARGGLGQRSEDVADRDHADDPAREGDGEVA
jgi:glycerol-3-phosphate dehydrogenase